MSAERMTDQFGDIAVIGMAGRFPGAENIHRFWHNLETGVESIVFFTDEELIEQGVDPVLLERDGYVKAGAVIERAEWFDAPFFSFSPAEATLMDPQVRVFLELAWHALEHAGWDPERYPGRVGVFSGMSMNTYIHGLSLRRRFLEPGELLQARLLNDKDFLSGWVSYKLDLRGPSVTVQTACSTSLVAVHLACQSLLAGECDMALAGGVAIAAVQKTGYLHQEGGIFSADGHCRAFDARAGGTVTGNGAGIVVLKRIDDAFRDGDTIHAVVKGSAINNDGASKLSFTAPSVEAQAEVIAEALTVAGVNPESISYLEAHGTGTPMGDPVEIAALTDVFRSETRKTGFCGIGSVKTNIGHLDAAAGVAGLIKTVLAMEHKKLPPSLHFKEANPAIDFRGSPFFVNDRIREWQTNGTPRLAGVSSFGVGGTNSHVVLQEPPLPEPPAPSHATWQALVLSARTRPALDALRGQLARFLRNTPDLPLADVAFTLQTGRKRFAVREALVCRNLAEAVSELSGPGMGKPVGETGPVAFMFPGQGSQYAGMAHGLYRTEPVFREHLNRCLDYLRVHEQLDLAPLLFPEHSASDRAEADLTETDHAQPALFALEYALARLWMEWGVEAEVMIGHSVGEYVAACLAGVFSVEDGLSLVARRGKLMRQLPRGAMFAVALGEAEVQPFLNPSCAVAAVNGPNSVVVSGSPEEVEQVRIRLRRRGIAVHPLRTRHAFHSAMMDPIVEAFAQEVARVPLCAPAIPFISNVTGELITAGQATDPGYWACHLRRTVRFHRGLQTLLAAGRKLLLEVGPGQALSEMARSSLDEGSQTVPSLRRRSAREADGRLIATSLGLLWQAGVPVDWNRVHREKRRRVPLPGYPFQRKPYFINVLRTTAPEPDPLPGKEPLTPAETMDRTGGTVPARPQPFATPREGLEQDLAAVWRKLLGIASIGRNDNFFELGGSSLMVTQMASRLRERIGLEFPIETFYSNPTIAGLAGDLAPNGRHSEKTGEGLPPLVPVPRSGNLPLSFAQQRLWFVARMETAGTAYSMPFALRLTGMLDRRALLSGLRAIVRRHEVLRTTFEERDGVPFQRIHRRIEPCRAIIDLEALCAAASRTAAEAERLIRKEAALPFRLESGPLFRVTLVRLSASETLMLANMHHIISDGWSIGVLVREMAASYRSAIIGEPALLPDQAVQYADFALWQRNWLQGDPLDRQVAYWRQRLAGLPPLLAFPTDRPRPSIPSFAGASIHFALKAEVSVRFQELARRGEATPFMVLLTVFKVLLARYSGQTDLAVGSPIANRRHPALEDLVGFFANTLVLRSNLGGNPSFREMLGRVKKGAIEAQLHQDLPFEHLVELLQPDRNLGHAPLFQVMFALQNAPLDALSLPGLTLTHVARETATAKFDLTLSLVPKAMGFRGVLEYSTDLFERETVVRLADHFRILLKACMEDPERNVFRLPMISEREHRELLVTWNETDRDYPSGRCLHDLFEDRAHSAPDTTAAVFGRAFLSYGTLRNRSALLCGYLKVLGLEASEPVGLYTKPSNAMVVGMLAILRAGGCYVPLDWDDPRERLGLLVADTRMRMVLAHKPENLPSCLAHVVDPDDPVPTHAPPVEPAPRFESNLPAYILFTSGSTGRPKGVVVAHSAVTRLVLNSSYIGIRASDNVAQASNISFDAATFEIWGALLNGARLVGLAKEDLLSLSELAGTLRSLKIGILFLTTALFNRIAAQAPRTLACLRYLLFGGEAVAPAMVARVLSEAAPERLLHVYGPTEGTTFSTWFPIAGVPPGSLTLPIGRPLSNTTAFVLDPFPEPVPIGVPGELFLGGDGLAQGYLNRPDATAEKFFPNPFDAESGRPGTRLYKTGDRVRYRLRQAEGSGNLEFMGRFDYQVKIRGFRIEPGEIESVLRARPEVEEAVVLLRETRVEAGTSPEKELIAFVQVPHADPEVEGSALVRELSTYLRNRLPRHMVPAEIIPLRVLPMNPNRKVDRVALDRVALDRVAQDRAFKAERGTGGRDPTPPGTATEARLIPLWREILNRDLIGSGDDFFELGGHSLSATRLIARVAQTFGVTLPVRGLFEEPRLAGFAALIDRAAEEEGSGVMALRRVGTSGPHPLSFAQQRLWFLSQLDGVSSRYNVPITVLLRGALCPSLLFRAFQAIVRRHEVLRTCFKPHGGEPVQEIDADLGPNPDFIDMRAIPDSRRSALLDRLLIAASLRPFDLSSAPLMRITLFRVSDHEHLMSVNMHHIIADGWSLQVLLEELAALYRTGLGDENVRLPELPVQYADFARCQREWLSGPVLKRQLDYWSRHLADLPPLLDLPLDRVRPRNPSYRGGLVPFSLSHGLGNSIRTLCLRAGATPFMAMLAAFKILLARYSGQTDFAVGTPVANRARPELEKLIGFFVNTLVLRSRIPDQPGFPEFLDRVRETTLTAFDHQDVPFEQLVEALQPRRSLAHHPLIQVMFQLHHDPLHELGSQGRMLLPGLKMEAVAVATPIAKFDLTLFLSDSGPGFSGSLEYSEDLFVRETAERLIVHYRTLLKGIVENPERGIFRIPLLTDSEMEEILVAWNETESAYPRNRSLPDLFESQARQTPDSIAVVYGRARLTYGELKSRSTELAGFLRYLGLAGGEPVGLYAERDRGMIVGLLAILQAGGCYVPLDRDYPGERLTFMATDTRLRVVLAHKGGRPPRWPGRVAWLDEPVPSHPVPAQSLAVVSAGQPAYIMYTSGSTGRPKGVVVPHRAVTRLVRNTDYVAFRASDGVAQASNISFDAATFEIWGALLNGARLVGIAKETLLSVRNFSSALRREKIGIMFLTTALFNQIAREDPEAFGPLRYLLVGGDAVDPSTISLVLGGNRPEHLLNGYGPTEATTFSNTFRFEDVEPEAASLPIGRPIANSGSYVLDPYLDPVSIGVPGELCLSGDGLAQGYLNRPGITAERFIPNPFAARPSRPGTRLYKTGDRARYGSGKSGKPGNVEFLGRFDRQIKIRGFRIEPGEIEAAIQGLPEVEDAVVLVRERGDSRSPREKELVAFVKLAGDADEEMRTPVPVLLKALKERLPGYMIPASMAVVDALPLTPNGKVDRAALERDLASRPPTETLSGRDGAPPETPSETRLSLLWGEILDRDGIGRYDDFFELGGHSLSATRLMSRIEETLDVALPVRALFENPTLAGLAERVDRTIGTERVATIPFHPISRADPLPLSYAQQRLWFLAQIEGERAHYNVPLALRLTGSLAPAFLVRSFERIVDRHEALRTCFATDRGEPVQVIAPHIETDLGFVDLQSLSAAIREPELDRLSTAASQQIFNLAATPLFRVLLCRLAEREHVLLVNMHHIVSDGWSLQVLLREMAAFYLAEIRDEPAELPGLPIQYADFAVNQRAWLRGSVLERQLAYWKEQLHGLPALLTLPTDRVRPTLLGSRGATITFSIPETLTAGLRALGRREGATLFMTLLAALKTLLAHYSGQADLAVGVPIANRTRPELAGLIGFFVNTLVLRSDLGGRPIFTEALNRIKETTLAAYDCQDVPFELLVKELAPQRSLSNHPLFQVSFQLDHGATALRALPGLVLTPLDLKHVSSKFDLGLWLSERGDGLSGALQYNTDLFRGETARLIARHFQNLLSSIANDPRAHKPASELMDAAERLKVLDLWNRNRAAYPPGLCLHQVFEARVARRPNAPALLFHRPEGEDGLWSYAALNEDANRLARYLIARGVGPETPVGFCVDRSPEMVIGLLAILKAGGAYLPLDPAYPGERISLMLADSGAPVVVTKAALADRIPAGRFHAIRIDAEADAIARYPGTDPSSEVMPENLAYIIYTSGTTGLPKGVMTQHRAIVSFIAARVAEYELGPADRMLQFATINFDSATGEIFSCLTSGGLLIPSHGEMLASSERFLEFACKLGITVSGQTTVFWSQVVQDLVEKEWSLPESLRLVVFGGERMHPNHLGVWRGYRGQRPHTVNAYGPTETTVSATAFHLPELLSETDWREIPIGKPLGNVRAYILDAPLGPVPIGVFGELLIGGENVGRGYFHEAAATAEKFIPDPYTRPKGFGRAGSRMYRSGDLARRRFDGNIEFLGRIDHQVKLRGFRIEPGDIETALEQHPKVRRALVMVREAGTGDKRLVVWLTVDGPLEATALQAFLKSKVPDYMVPSRWVFLDEFPMLPNRKIDRSALPEPDCQESVSPRYEPAVTEVQAQLVRLWEEVLELRNIGIYDNFFELGGHSLLATRLISRMDEAFSASFPVRMLFEAPTIAELEPHIVASRDRDRGRRLPLSARSRSTPPPLSFAQQRLWFLFELEGPSPVYNIPSALRLTGALDSEILIRAFLHIAARHESLRTGFGRLGGEPVQVISPDIRPVIPLLDLNALPAKVREREAQRLARTEAATPFDLTSGPPFRIRLLRLGPTEHLLLATMHHIISDGWSSAVLVGELSKCYGDFRLGNRPYLPELSLQYADFAHCQREWLAGEVLEEQLAYWQRQLAGLPPLLDLPTDHVRPARRRFQGNFLSFSISREVQDRLSVLSRSRGATLFMALTAIVQTLLSRYSGQTDIALGTPIANRTRPELENLIGLFVNTLVLRTRLSRNDSFDELLSGVRDTALAAYRHQDLPFERLVEAVNPDRSLSHAPLFQVMLVMQNLPRADLNLPGLHWEPLPLPAASPKFDLTLAFTESPEALQGDIQFDTDLFEMSTISRLAKHLKTLAVGIAEDPGRPLHCLPLMDPQELLALEARWFGPTKPRFGERCIHHLFEAAEVRNADAVALVFSGGDRRAGLWTYAALNRGADRLAKLLAKMGVGPGACVAICLDRSFEMLAAMLGTLKAGASYVVLEPGQPPDRLAAVLAEAAPQRILTLSGIADRLPGTVVPTTFLDRLRSGLGEGSSGLSLPPPNPEFPAYLVFTSGSSGRPKGIPASHANVTNYLEYLLETYGLNSGDVGLQLAGPGFDASVRDLIAPLCAGARVVMIPSAIIREGSRLLDRMVLFRVTRILSVVPSLLSELLEAARETTLRPASLKTILVSGETLTPALCRMVRTTFGSDVLLVNQYGPTETTLTTSYRFVEPGYEDADEIPIGKPIPNTGILVLDPFLRPALTGVWGELCIAGVGLAPGYLGQPSRTGACFVPNPHGGQAGTRLFKTGDLGRLRADGRLCFKGRADHQLKLRGIRVEPGEIESVLRRHPEVESAAVVLSPQVSASGGLLVAWLTQSGTARVGAAELGEFLRDRLPEYMIPARFMFLDALPRTANGKIDRRTLAKRFVGEPGPSGGELPRNAEEETLAGIWSEIMGPDRVGVHDNFFELGGHSLLASRLMARVGKAYGTTLPVRMLFEAPTIAELGRRIRESRGRELSALLPLDRVPRNGPLTLSFAQQRLWFLVQLDGPSPAYNIPVALQISGHLDRLFLDRAFREILYRHESLRTTFETVGETPVQIIAQTPCSTIPMVDLSGLSEKDRAIGTRHLVRAEARLPFDLIEGPLIRVNLLRQTATDHVLLATLHHIVSDGWSSGLLVRELTALYRAYRNGEPLHLPELPIQYADFSHCQRKWLEGEALAGQLAYWRDQLAELPPFLDLPSDRPRPQKQGNRGEMLNFSIPRDLTDRLATLSRENGATLFMTLLAAFQVLLARYAGQRDIAVGTPIANRTRPELEELIGFFVNTLVMRARLGPEMTFYDLVTQVRETTLSAYSHQDIPFERVVEALNPERSLSRTPLFQAMLIMQNLPDTKLRLPELHWEALPAASSFVKFDLTLILSETAEGLSGWLQYGLDLFEADSARRMADHYETLLRRISAHPERRISDHDLMTAAERAVLLEDWEITRTAFPGRCLHRLFEAQAARTPDAAAIWDATSPHRRICFAELDGRANLLASRLRANGVGLETAVAVSLERSVGMVVALLAVLKAGGAFVPLDPSYPAERLRAMLEDSQATVLVARGELRPRLAGNTLTLVDPDGDLQPNNLAMPIGRASSPANPAYLIYTSGSTGSPKGILATHGATVNRLSWMWSEFGFGSGEVCCLKTSLNFVDAIWEVFGPLLGGVPLVSFPDAAVKDLVRFAALLAENRVTRIVMVPSLLRALLDIHADLAGRLPRLRVWITSGEALSAEMVQRFRSSRNPAGVTDPDEPVLLNLYGSSEVAADVSFHRILGDPGDGAVPIGTAIANTRLYVVDPALRPQPLGIRGELTVSGIALARCYWKRPVWTAAVFVPNPFPGEPGSRLFRTGDRARFIRTRGSSRPILVCLGRIDRQVKIRGFRIELREVETVLARHPEVVEAVVFPREHGVEERILVAYLTMRSNGHSAIAALREFLKGSLPEPMIPALFEPLEAMPLTPNGKIDRLALARRPLTSGIGTETAGVEGESHTPVMEILTGLWYEVLGGQAAIARITSGSQFFEIGGHSLLATRLVARIRHTFGVELPVSAIFETPTLKGLASRVQRVRGIEAEDVPLTALSRPKRLPLSFAQQRLWFLSQLEGARTDYNLTHTSSLDGILDVAALVRSFREVIRRHESLRTVFPRLEDRPVQKILDDADPHLVLVDLLSLTDGSSISPNDLELRRLFLGEARRPFELEGGPLFRVLLVRRSAHAHSLLLNMHHIVSDGWSIGVLIRELATGYKAFATGGSPSFPALSVQYCDFALWQRQRLQGAFLEKQLEYWKRQLAKLPPHLNLPTDFPRPAKQSHRTGWIHFRIPKSLSADLRSLSVDEGVTLFMTLLAGYQVLLAGYSGQDDITVGCPIANRTRPELERLIGFFVNTLVLRLDLSASRDTGSPTFSELLNRIRTVALDAYAHQDVPFEKLVEALRPKRDLSRTLFFQAMLIFQNMPGSFIELPGLTLRLPGDRMGSEVRSDLDLYAAEDGEGIKCVFSYSADLFEGGTIRRMADRFLTLLGHIARAANTCIDDLVLDEPPLIPGLESDKEELPAAGPDPVPGEDRYIEPATADELKILWE